MRHSWKWDVKEDVCINCGLKRLFFTEKDGKIIQITSYMNDNGDTFKNAPPCEKK